MTEGKCPENATLLDILIDGFEKNEILRGFHWRELPMPDAAAAERKFAALVEEAGRWKGAPSRVEDRPGRRLAAWTDLEVRQAGRGIMLRVKAPEFGRWWHESATWEASPMGPLFDWIEER
jgi:hypothetical protein